MWLVFFVAAPQLEITYELRIRFAERQAWDCNIFVGGQLRTSFDGDGDTSANEFLLRVFDSIGAPGMVPIGD